MTITRTRLADAAPTPWRNGGGSTRELLAWPQVQAWQVRVSVATISRDGPFSAYPGVDRCFAVLQGAGVVLQLPQGPQVLTTDSDPVAFDGEAAPACSLVDGQTQDLNLMVRRGLGQAAMWRAGHAASGGASALSPGMPVHAPGITGATRWRGVYAASACTLRAGSGSDSQDHDITAGELLWSDAADDADWLLIDASQAWCLVVR